MCNGGFGLIRNPPDDGARGFSLRPCCCWKGKTNPKAQEDKTGARTEILLAALHGVFLPNPEEGQAGPAHKVISIHHLMLTIVNYVVEIML